MDLTVPEYKWEVVSQIVKIDRWINAYIPKNYSGPVFLYYFHISSQNQLIPEDKREEVVSHIVKVHQSVGDFSTEFMQKLRRANYVTPKHYLDYINSYLKLLEDKDKYIQRQVGALMLFESIHIFHCSLDVRHEKRTVLEM